MTVFSLATETYNGSEINVDLFATRREAYEALAHLILPATDQAPRLNALLDRINEDPSVDYETVEAFRLELDATEWIGVVQNQSFSKTFVVAARD